MEHETTSRSVPAKRVIAALAILTANMAEGKDYVDIFVPLVGHCIYDRKPSVISVTELQNQMKDTFGMQIPLNALKLVLRRTAKRGYIKEQKGAYVPNLEVLAGLNFGTKYQDVIRQQNDVTKMLAKFASDKFGISLSQAEAEDAFLAYLQKHDIEILEFLLSAEAPPVVQAQQTRKLDFVVNSFIVEAYESNPEGFKYIDTIVKGHFLSHTLFFPDLGRFREGFAGRRYTLIPP
jgi:hypothetical protein